MDGSSSARGISGRSSPRVSPRGAGGGANGRPQMEGKMRALDEYLTHFPVDRPHSAVGLMVKSNAEAESFIPTKGHKQATLDMEIKKFEQEALTRKVGKEAATKTFNNLRKKQNYDGWLAVAERNNRKLRRENDTLGKLAQVAQENCIDNDSKYEEVLADLRANVELAAIIRRNDDPNLKLMQTQFEVIDRRIDDICETAKEQVAVEYVNLKNAFEKQVDKQAEKLKVIKESGKTTTEQWRQRNSEVQEGLLNVMQRLIDADEEKKILEKDLQKLRVAFGAQDNDGPLLEKEFTKASARHRQLKERLQVLEAQVSQRNAAHHSGGVVEEDVCASTKQLIEQSGAVGATLASRNDYQRQRHGGGGGTPSVKSSTRGDQSPSNMLTDAERRQKDFAQTLANAEELLETEAQNLRTIRATHAAALKQRTELEVYLLQAILYHRRYKEHKIKEGALIRPHSSTVDDNNTQSAELIFDADDRKKVIEQLLSQERVIKLLYGVAEGRAGQPREEAYAITPSLASQGIMSDQAEVSQLWDKWRQWTLGAQSSLNRHYATASTEQ